MKTEYIEWDKSGGYRENELAKAAEILRQGGLVAFPTETVYGLGGNGLMKEAAEKIYAAKGRPSDNPLILHISKREELDAIVKSIPETAEKLMRKFWPGPMTLIFEKADIVPLETTGGLSTVAVRMPSHEGARSLIAAAGVPVAAPSANTSGRPSPTRAEHVREDLDGRIDMIIDGGAVGIGIESTIIDVTESVPVILRPGHITKEAVSAVIGEVMMDPGLAGNEDAHPKAPGMKYRHYAPKASMTIYEGSTEAVTAAIREAVKQYPPGKAGILAAEETAGEYPEGQVIVAGSRVRHTVGQGLYAALREFDHLGVEVIFSESFSEEEESEAIMNRLLKAAGHNLQHLSENEKR
jgi:L-threonylcarbamoyladenylate synthase